MEDLGSVVRAHRHIEVTILELQRFPVVVDQDTVLVLNQTADRLTHLERDTSGGLELFTSPDITTRIGDVLIELVACLHPQQFINAVDV
ncbi:hypothetical protein D3C87_1848160 [compost metagenome]